MARAAKAARTRIRILPHRSVVIDGQAVGEGSEADVPAADAETLIGEGYAEAASKPRPSRPKRARSTKQAPRKKLTPKAIENGEEERGG